VCLFCVVTVVVYMFCVVTVVVYMFCVVTVVVYMFCVVTVVVYMIGVVTVVVYMFCVVTVVSMVKIWKSLYEIMHGRTKKKQVICVRIVLHSEQSRLLICVQITCCCCLRIFTALQIQCALDRQQYRTVCCVCVVCHLRTLPVAFIT